jgi:integrase
MTRGDGSIFRPKGHKVWMMRFYGPRPNGSGWGLIRESAKTDDEAKARKKLAARLRQVANDRDGLDDFETPAHRRVRVGELFDDLLADYTFRQIKGLDRVRVRLAVHKGRDGAEHMPALREVFGPRLAASVTTADVTRFMTDRRAKGFEAATINREVELLRRAFNLGRESGRIRRVPKFPKKLRENNARQGFFETGDFQKLVPHLPEPLAAMARFAFKTGWRRGELLGLRWEWIDRTDGVVTIPDSKNDDPRAVPLDDELAAIIEERWQAREYVQIGGAIGISEYVFHSNGKPIPTSTFSKQFRRARAAAGIPPSRLFHDFRRTAARNMVRGGTPQSVARTVTGHRSDSMFSRYNITSLDDQRVALERARSYAESRAAIGENVTPFRPNEHTDEHTLPEVWRKAPPIVGDLVGMPGFEPGVNPHFS